MTRKLKHTEDEVLKALSRKRDARVNRITKEIYILTGTNPQYSRNNDLGNSSWGKIDFLVNYCGYSKIPTDKL